MIKDLLGCKEKALKLTGLENPHFSGMVTRRDFMNIMKEMWEELGYVSLGLSAQNLRHDQAAKAEGILQSASRDKASVCTSSAVLNTNAGSSTQDEFEIDLKNLVSEDGDELDLHIALEQTSILHMNS